MAEVSNQEALKAISAAGPHSTTPKYLLFAWIEVGSHTERSGELVCSDTRPLRFTRAHTYSHSSSIAKLTADILPVLLLNEPTKA
jgi:hypothetical protein